MLKRSKLLVAFLVVTVLCASIGFAAVSDTLKGSGTFNVDADSTELSNQFDANVYFTNAGTGAAIGNDNGVEGTDKAIDVNDTLTITVPDGELAVENDTWSVTVDVKNDNKTAANIRISDITNANSKYVTVAVTGANQIAGDGTQTYTITFTLVKAPSTDIAGTFSFTITATSAG